MSKVAVIIPAYNSERFLAATIESVQAQIYSNWECIIVDDGSTDRTAEIAESFATSDTRIRLIRKANAGVAEARNTGMQHLDAASEYVIFMDNDDLFEIDALGAMTESISAHPGCAGVHGLAEMIDSQGEILMETGFSSYLSRRRRVVNSCFVECSQEVPTSLDVVLSTPIYPPGIVMVKTRAVRDAGPFDKSLRGTSDLDMWIRIAKKGTLGFLPKRIVQYRRHDKNESNVPAYMWKEIRRIRHKAFVDPQTSSENRAIIKGFYRALQRERILEKCQKVAKDCKSGRVIHALRNTLSIAAHAMMLLRGKPSIYG